jgi:carbon monoxide dehydrogenase subunit G
MPSAQRSITINRPIEDVFAFISDGENGSKWRSDKIDVRHESGSGVGAVYRQTVPGPGGRRVKADYEVTVHQPPTRSEFKAIAGPVRPTGSYILEPAGEGKTRLTFSLDAQLGFVKRLLMGGAVQRSMDAEMAALDRLKDVLEAPAG